MKKIVLFFLGLLLGMQFAFAAPIGVPFQITDANKNPVNDASICISHNGYDYKPYAITDEYGKATLSLQEGGYYQIIKNGYPIQEGKFMLSEEPVLVKYPTLTPVTINLKNTLNSITTPVINNTKVSIYRENDVTSYSTNNQADANGNYTFFVEKGNYNYCIERDRYPAVNNDFTVEQTSLSIPFVFENYHPVDIKVFNAQGNNYNASICIFKAGTKNAIQLFSNYPITGNNPTLYLQDGDYTYNLSFEGGDFPFSSGAFTVTPHFNTLSIEYKDVTFALKDGATDKALLAFGIRGEIHDINKNYITDFVTNENGKASVVNLATGKYLLSLNSFDYNKQSYSQANLSFMVSSSGENLVTIPYYKATFTLTDGINSIPSADASGTIFIQGTDIPINGFNTDAAGSATLNLVPGKYRYMINSFTHENGNYPEVSADFTLSSTLTIPVTYNTTSLTLMDASNNTPIAVEGVSATLSDKDEREYQIFFNTNGTVSVILEEGTYHYTIHQFEDQGIIYGENKGVLKVTSSSNNLPVLYNKVNFILMGGPLDTLKKEDVVIAIDEEIFLQTNTKGMATAYLPFGNHTYKLYSFYMDEIEFPEISSSFEVNTPLTNTPIIYNKVNFILTSSAANDTIKLNNVEGSLYSISTSGEKEYVDDFTTHSNGVASIYLTSGTYFFEVDAFENEDLFFSTNSGTFEVNSALTNVNIVYNKTSFVLTDVAANDTIKENGVSGNIITDTPIGFVLALRFETDANGTAFVYLAPGNYHYSIDPFYNNEGVYYTEIDRKFTSNKNTNTIKILYNKLNFVLSRTASTDTLKTDATLYLLNTNKEFITSFNLNSEGVGTIYADAANYMYAVNPFNDQELDYHPTPPTFLAVNQPTNVKVEYTKQRFNFKKEGEALEAYHTINLFNSVDESFIISSHSTDSAMVAMPMGSYAYYMGDFTILDDTTYVNTYVPFTVTTTENPITVNYNKVIFSLKDMTGAPLVNAPISLYQQTENILNTQSALDGTLALYMANSLYEYTVNPGLYPPKSGSFTLNNNNESIKINYQDHYSASLMVLDNEENPLPNLMISITGTNVSLTGMYTDSDGKITQFLPNGTYTYTIERSQYPTLRGTFTINNAELEKEVKYETANLQEVTFTLKGAENNTLNSVLTEVYVYNTNGEYFTLTETNGGVGTVNIPNGNYKYVVSNFNYNSSSYITDTIPFTVNGNTPIDIIFYKYTVNVLADGSPIHVMDTLSIYNSKSNLVKDLIFYAENEKYEFYASPGSYFFKKDAFVVGSHLQTFLEVSAPFTVSKNEENNQSELNYYPAHFNVLNADSIGLANANINLYKGNRLITTLTTNASGETYAYHLPNGGYTYITYYSDKAPKTGSFMINNQAVHKTIRFEADTLYRNISFNITMSNTTNIFSRSIFLYDQSNNLIVTNLSYTNRESFLLLNGNYGYVIHVTTENGTQQTTGTFSVLGQNREILVSIAPIVVALNKTELNLLSGTNERLVASITPENAKADLFWNSSNSNVAVVDAYGLVTATHHAGTALISVTTADGKQEAACVVTVTNTPEPVSSVTLNKTSLKVKRGADPIQLIAIVNPGSAANKQVVWSSNNPKVVRVDQYGFVFIVNQGIAEVTVTTVEGGKTATCLVTVSLETEEATPVMAVQVQPQSLTLAAGGPLGIVSAVVTPAQATNQNVFWSSTDEAVATVDDNGKITPLATGNAKIVATTVDGNKTDTCFVTVVDTYVAVSGVNLNPQNINLVVGQSQMLTATVSPAEATNPQVTWSANEPTIASVNNGSITALTTGSTYIYVLTADGGKTDSCKVTVTDSVAVSGIVLSHTSLSIMQGNMATLTATVQPTNATIKKVNWSSDNTAIATVDNNGTVNALAEGSATITATTQQGNFSTVCVVTVTKNTTDITEVAVLEAAIYPNPVQTYVTIEMTETIQTVRLFTVNGQFIKQVKAGSTKLRLPMEDCAPGTYVVEIVTAKGTRLSKTIIKQ